MFSKYFQLENTFKKFVDFVGESCSVLIDHGNRQNQINIWNDSNWINIDLKVYVKPL